MDGDRLLLPEQVAELIPGVTRQYLAILRHRGGGPVYVKLGRKVLYRESDVNAWIEAGLHTRTDRPVAR